MPFSQNPWYQYLNPLVVLITISLTSTAIGSFIPLSYEENNPMPKKVGDGVAIANLFGALGLSLFIIIGLQGIKTRNRTLHHHLKELSDIDNIENNYGSTQRALNLATSGQLLSTIGGCLNALAIAITTIGANESDNNSWHPREWAISSLLLSYFANLTGFFLFNVLGGRNDALQLLEKKLKDEIFLENKPAETQQQAAPIFQSAAGAGLTELQKRRSLANTQIVDSSPNLSSSK